MDNPEGKKDKRYLVESPHSAVQCAHALKQIGARGFITRFNWACKSGIHTGWAIFEAESEQEAMNILPPFLRATAKVTKVDLFRPDEVESWQDG